MHALDSVHTRHLVIHQNDMVEIFLRLIQGFLSGGNQLQFDPRIPEKLRHDHEVGRRVVHNKHLCIRSFKRLHINMLLPSPLSVQHINLTQRLIHNDFLRNLDYKSGSFRIHAVDRDLSTHKIDKLLDDGETEPSTLDIFVLIHIDAFKGRKQIGDTLRFDTHACIAYGIGDQRDSGVVPLTLNLQAYGTLARVFNSIIQDINQDLLDTHVVSEQFRRKVRRYIYRKLEILLLCAYPQHTNDVGKHIPGAVRCRREFHLTRFKF